MRGGKCECFVCLKGRKGINSKYQTPIICVSTGKKEDLKICGPDIEHSQCMYCFQKIGKGIRHPCTKLERQKNLSSLVRSTSPTTKGEILFYQMVKCRQPRNSKPNYSKVISLKK